MKVVLALALLSRSALAFVGSPSTPAPLSVVSETKADLEVLAKELNPIVGFYDPLGLADANFWGKSEEETIGFLRHAEIKHGRVAMAAFSGYCLQSNGVHWPWPMTMGGDSFAGVGGSPPEQWDAIPVNGKIQILAFVGFLEAYSELAGTHYMKGGRAGEYPSFKAAGADKFLPVDLFDPAGFSSSMSPAQSKKGLLAEINNGRLAMLAVIAFVSEGKIPGSVPALTGLGIPAYAGDVMMPFEGNFRPFAENFHAFGG